MRTADALGQGREPGEASHRHLPRDGDTGSRLHLAEAQGQAVAPAWEGHRTPTLLFHLTLYVHPTKGLQGGEREAGQLHPHKGDVAWDPPRSVLQQGDPAGKHSPCWGARGLTAAAASTV